MIARLLNSLRVEVELAFTSPNTVARVTCPLDGATIIVLALLLYKSPFNDIVSSRAMS